MLVRYGYPYVMSEFRFHMTLSNAIADEVLRTQFWNKASLWFAEVLSEPIAVNQVAIYKENERAGIQLVQNICPRRIERGAAAMLSGQQKKAINFSHSRTASVRTPSLAIVTTSSPTTVN